MEDNKDYRLVESDDACIVSEPQSSWGGAWTEEKLDALEKYVRAYLTVMKKYAKENGWKLFYFDAFAGSGSREIESVEEKNIDNTLFREKELEKITEQASYKGAAERIMGLEVDGFSFDYFYFIDKDKKSLHKLQEKLKSLFPHKASCMAFRPGDANERILELVSYARNNPKCAALVLLDPFGMQLNWETISALKEIKHIDLWILVPSGVIINRLLTRSGKILCPERMEMSFGLSVEELQKYFYEQITELGLFGEMTRQKKRDDTINRIAQLYIELLSKEFQFVIKEPLVLRNSTSCPIFHFIFASHNRNGVKIASQIVGKKNRK
ncbi:MAG: three-Cys-motif partner protein TcmP [Muribaculaceae bacterium]|nr:three-Cys-motif partner protein TcmP [Muribaculaceae bacterium]